MRRILYSLVIMMAASLWCPPPGAIAQEDASPSAREYQIKAAYLYNFVKFVEWPGAQSLTVTHAATICIVGENPFGAAMDIFRKASSPQLALNVKVNAAASDLPGCHILFISRLNEDSIPSLLARAQAYPVLTVSDASGFADKGGIIEMVKVAKNIGLFSKDKINLRINIKAALEQHLRIDPQLLEIAAEVIK